MGAPFVSLAERVLAKWRAVGVSRDDEVADAPAALDALERVRGIVLPPSFRELWTLSDGTASPDDDGFTFWPLDNVTSDPSLGPWRGLLVFADWQLGAPYFCLRFEGERAGSVVDADGHEVAASFDVFLEHYLADAKAIVVERQS